MGKFLAILSLLSLINFSSSFASKASVTCNTAEREGSSLPRQRGQQSGVDVHRLTGCCAQQEEGGELSRHVAKEIPHAHVRKKKKKDRWQQSHLQPT